MKNQLHLEHVSGSIENNDFALISHSFEMLSFCGLFATLKKSLIVKSTVDMKVRVSGN